MCCTLVRCLEGGKEINQAIQNFQLSAFPLFLNLPKNDSGTTAGCTLIARWRKVCFDGTRYVCSKEYFRFTNALGYSLPTGRVTRLGDFSLNA
jgi:hypothetical protein